MEIQNLFVYCRWSEAESSRARKLHFLATSRSWREHSHREGVFM